MSQIIKSYPSIPFDELNYCHDHGIMYQRDMTVSVSYDKHYFEKYARYENSPVANALNKGRTGITEKYCAKLLDIGIGSGEFIKQSNIRVYGFDINPVGVKWLRENGLFVDPYTGNFDVDGFTFWDALEHIPDPDQILGLIRSGMYAFVSIPIFRDLCFLKKSKHYRPNEHYYYYTVGGLTGYFKDAGFKLVEMSDYESQAGREDILTFVFQKA